WRATATGVAALADLEQRDWRPDRLEIAFRDAHPRVAPRAGRWPASYTAQIHGGNRPARNRPCAPPLPRTWDHWRGRRRWRPRPSPAATRAAALCRWRRAERAR